MLPRPDHYDKTGRRSIRFNGAIDDKPSIDPADVPNAKNYITAALTEAMSGKTVSTPTTRPSGCSVKYAN
jgi:hypothetical protein